jgi:hypothetical protein
MITRNKACVSGAFPSVRRCFTSGVVAAGAGILTLGLVVVPPETDSPRSDARAVQLTGYAPRAATTPAELLREFVANAGTQIAGENAGTANRKADSSRAAETNPLVDGFGLDGQADATALLAPIGGFDLESLLEIPLAVILAGMGLVTAPLIAAGFGPIVGPFVLFSAFPLAAVFGSILHGPTIVLAFASAVVGLFGSARPAVE